MICCSIWTTSLGNSVIYQSGSNVGIGTAAPNYKLHVVENSSIKQAIAGINTYSGDGIGVYGQGNRGVYGYGNTYGVLGYAPSGSTYGVYGYAAGAPGSRN